MQITIKNDNRTILAQILEQTEQMEYGCKDGFCGLCKLKKKENYDFYYIDEPLAFFDKEEFLPCITKANKEFNLKLGE